MKITEYIHEMRGIARGELISYFFSIGGHLSGTGHITGLDWEVEVGEEHPVRLGSFT